MRHILILIFAATSSGCVSADQQLLNTWWGVYALNSQTEVVDDCTADPVEIAADPPFFEFAAIAGDEAHLVELRACSTKNECERTWFLNGITETATNTRITTGWGEWLFTLSGGTNGSACNVNYVGMDITRTGVEADALDIVLTNHAGVNSDVRTEEECIDFLTVAAKDDEACNVKRVMSARRVD